MTLVSLEVLLANPARQPALHVIAIAELIALYIVFIHSPDTFQKKHWTHSRPTLPPLIIPAQTNPHSPFNRITICKFLQPPSTLSSTNSNPTFCQNCNAPSKNRCVCKYIHSLPPSSALALSAPNNAAASPHRRYAGATYNRTTSTVLAGRGGREGKRASKGTKPTTPTMGPGRGGEAGGEVAGDDASDGDEEEVGDGDAARATTKTAFGCARHVSSLRASSGKSWARAALLKCATAAASAGCIGAMVHGAGGDGDGATWGA
jgi:hypothetical protein